MRSGRLAPAVLAGLVVVIGSLPASAHNLDERYGPLLGNFLHPLTALDHGLAFAALGLWAGQQGRAAAGRTLGAFLAGLVIGTSLPAPPASALSSLLPLTAVNIGSVVALGTLVALARPLPLSLLMALAGLLGLSHGLENGLERVPESRGALSVLGVTAAGLLAGGLMALLAATRRIAWQQVGVRVLGSWIAAIGLMMLGLHLR